MPTEEQTYRQGMIDTVKRIESKIDTVDTKVTYTNGKVRKIIIALVLLAGILIGTTATNTHDLISLFTHIL